MSNLSQPELEQVARICKALGSAARLQLLADLVACCNAGVCAAGVAGQPQSEGATLNAGDLCCNTDLAQSTVSFHLKELREAGLIEMERQGKQLHYRASLSQLKKLAALFGKLTAGTGKPEASGGCCVIVRRINKTEAIR